MQALLHLLKPCHYFIDLLQFTPGDLCIMLFILNISYLSEDCKITVLRKNILWLAKHTAIQSSSYLLSFLTVNWVMVRQAHLWCFSYQSSSTPMFSSSAANPVLFINPLDTKIFCRQLFWKQWQLVFHLFTWFQMPIMGLVRLKLWGKFK